MASTVAAPSYPPPPPPGRLKRPKITLQIPNTPAPMTPRTASVYWTPSRYPKPPGTPGSHMSDPHGLPYMSPFGHMYHSKASEFMFKQFKGFKDFTMDAAKSGLSAGEKFAFWFYNKLRILSKRWFTHLFLTFSLVLYSAIGAGIFMTLESGYEEEAKKNLTTVRRQLVDKMALAIVNNNLTFEDDRLDFLSYIEDDLMEYEAGYTECMKHLSDNLTQKATWSFWNSMFYAGTIYTTIDKFERT